MIVKSINEHFRETIEFYGVSAKQLAEVSGISEQHISQFRRSKSSVSTDVLLKLLDGIEVLEPRARAYFCSRLAGDSVPASEIQYLLDRVEHLDMADFAEVMRVVAKKLSEFGDVKVKMVVGSPRGHKPVENEELALIG